MPSPVVSRGWSSGVRSGISANGPIVGTAVESAGGTGVGKNEVPVGADVTTVGRVDLGGDMGVDETGEELNHTSVGVIGAGGRAVSWGLGALVEE